MPTSKDSRHWRRDRNVRNLRSQSLHRLARLARSLPHAISLSGIVQMLAAREEPGTSLLAYDECLTFEEVMGIRSRTLG